MPQARELLLHSRLTFHEYDPNEYLIKYVILPRSSVSNIQFSLLGSKYLMLEEARQGFVKQTVLHKIYSSKNRAVQIKNMRSSQACFAVTQGFKKVYRSRMVDLGMN